MSIEQNFVTLNNAGNSPSNPIVPGTTFRIYYHRHDQNEAPRKCWVQVTKDPANNWPDPATGFTKATQYLPAYHAAGGEIFKDLTSRMEEGTAADGDDGTYRVWAVAGVDLKAGASDSAGPELNKIIWTTSNGIVVNYLYVAPDVSRGIILNGCDGSDPLVPYLDILDATNIPAEPSGYEFPEGLKCD